MKDFEYYIGEGEVKKQSPDRNLSDSLAQDARKRFNYSLSQKLDEKSAKYIYEDIYDSLRAAIDALLALQGFKSYSHAAGISFLKRFGFPDNELEFLEKMRKRRNGMKYYGKTCSVPQTKEAIDFARKTLQKLDGILAKISEEKKSANKNSGQKADTKSKPNPKDSKKDSRGEKA